MTSERGGREGTAPWRREIALALGFSLVVSCTDRSTYVYLAREYVEAGDCVKAPAAVAVMDGVDYGGTCDAVCSRLSGDAASAAGTKLVSRQCSVLPASLAPADGEPWCERAKAALLEPRACPP